MNGLTILAIIWLLIGVMSALIIALDMLLGRKQKMMVMNFVYPITGLYGGLLALAFYYRIGRASSLHKNNRADSKLEQHAERPFWQSVAIGALHCGSGCALGDMLAELFLAYVPVVVYGSNLAGKWTIDYVFAFAIGIVFQYYSIKPMKNLSPLAGLKAAIKTDALSLTSWQLGMYGCMAIAIFVVFKHGLKPNEPLFWFMMQIAMIFGFATAYPTNWWLIKKGVKEVM